ncbi:ABC transporter substrate-binding protein [Robertmurraya sp.]|jgi:putative aldouronate transport system substrate-binding protein|uniref:ABC transporter substrate-binding protein n=1 Tax=Robertmurraya sp. TaxID=2837525 RepID=UPI003703E8C4
MKNKKRIVSLVLSLSLVGSILTACKSDPTSSPKSDGKNGEVEKVVLALPTFNNIPQDYSEVEEAINKITEEKINVEVDLQLYGPADYNQKVNLALQSGEQMDLFVSLGNFTTYLSKNQLYPLDGLLEKYGADTVAILENDFGPNLLKSTTSNGEIYGIPANKGMSLPPTFVYNADMLAEVGFSPDDIQSVDDLPAIFEAVKEKYPDVVPFGPVNVNPSDPGLVRLIKSSAKVDSLTDDTGVGVVIGDSGNVVNFYETDEFKDGIEMVRGWYEKGYLQKDAATTTIGMAQMMSSDRGFSFIAAYGGLEAGKAISAQTGKNIEMKRISPFYFDTSATNAVTWMMSSTTKVPDAAMKLLNMTYTDKELLNTILFGIEGRDYEVVDEHHVKYPDGKSAANVPYTAQLSSGILGSESLQYQLEGMSYEDVNVKITENRETERSPYFGFIFDQTPVKTELSTINNVVNQYLPGLVTGSLDPETTLPKFIKALNDAGAKNVINEKQKQLDKWIEDQK